MMLVPLTGLSPSDVIALFDGPFVGDNYVGSGPATITIRLVGTGHVRIETNYTILLDGGTEVPNPNSWQPFREIVLEGTTVVRLTPLNRKNWIRVVCSQAGTGTCEVSSEWDLPGSVVDPLIYSGTWNAETNTPTITSGVGLRGQYYVVTVPGATSIDGANSWGFGDLIMFNGSQWIKKTNTAANTSQDGSVTVDSVAGRTGDVILSVDDIIDISSTYVPVTQLGVPNGVAVLDASGHIDPNEIPVVGLDSIADLKALTDRPAVVTVAGKTALADGWGGTFYWVAGSTTTADDALVVRCTAGAAGRYKRLYSGPVNALWFGVKGDDSTNNDTAIAAIVSYLNANGGELFWPRGIYRHNSPFPTITRGCVIIGEGATMSHNGALGPADSGGTYGTVLRHNATSGNTITIAVGTYGTTIRDIGFWPVLFKTSGAEIVDHGVYSYFENLSFIYSNRAIDFSNGSNGSTARTIRSFGMWGTDHIRVKGSSDSIADWAQAIIIDDFEAYQPWQVAEPLVTTTTTAWVANHVYATGAITVANGYVWQAVSGGTSAAAGSGPTRPSYSYAGEPTTLGVTDNTVTWKMIQTDHSAAVNIDSRAVDVHINNSYLLTTYFGVLIQNTDSAGIVPQYIQIVDTLMDHNVSDGCFAPSGYQIVLRGCKFHLSATGRGFTGGSSFTSGLQINGGHVWANALEGILLPQVANMDATVQGVSIIGNGTKTANTYSGILTAASVSGFVITDNHIGSDGGGTTQYGVSIAAGNDKFSVSNNELSGNGTGAILNSSGISSTRIVENNIGDVTNDSRYASHVTNLAALKALVSRPQTVIMEYYSVAGDDGGGIFRWEAGSSTTADDGLVVQCTSGAAGRYKRIYSGPINVCWFGITKNSAGAATANATAIQAAINAADGNPVYFPAGIYYIGSKITSSTPVHIIGAGNGTGPGALTYANCTILVPTYKNDNLFEITTGYVCEFEDFRVELQGGIGTATSGAGIKIIGEGGQTNANTKINNVGFVSMYRGIDILRPAYPHITGCYFQGWVDAAIHMETSTGIEGSGGFVERNYFYGDSSSNACIRMKCGYFIISHNEILSSKTGILMQIAGNPAGFLRIHDNTIENQTNYGVALYSDDGSTAGLVDWHDNEFSTISDTGSFVAHIFISENGGTTFVEEAMIINNTTRSLLTLSGSKHIWVANGQNVRIAGNQLCELGSASPGGIQFTGGSANGLVAPVSGEDNSFLGTFGFKYSVGLGAGSAKAVRIRHQSNDITFSQVATYMPASAIIDGSMVYVSDGTPGSSLSGSGTGSLALMVNGAWKGL